MAGSCPTRSPGKRHLVLRTPVGVVGAIAPWNFPLVLAMRKVAPALAAGCPVILKPASATPLSAVMFAEAVDAGGPAAGRVPIGGRPGRGDCRRTAGESDLPQDHLHRLDGSRPPIDRRRGPGRSKNCRWNWAATRRCWSSPTPISTRPCRERSSPSFATRANRASPPIGCTSSGRSTSLPRAAGGQDPGPENRQRPGRRRGDRPADQRARPWIRPWSTSAEAVDSGARVACGGRRWNGSDRRRFPGADDPGRRAPRPSACARRPSPRVAGVRVRRRGEAIREANDTRYGLAAYAFTRDMSRMWRLAEGLEAGTIGINDWCRPPANAPSAD